jgi:hypothetical protein
MFRIEILSGALYNPSLRRIDGGEWEPWTLPATRDLAGPCVPNFAYKCDARIAIERTPELAAMGRDRVRIVEVKGEKVSTKGE